MEAYTCIYMFHTTEEVNLFDTTFLTYQMCSPHVVHAVMSKIKKNKTACKTF